MEARTKKIFGTLAFAAAVGGGFYLIKKGKKLLAGAKMNFAVWPCEYCKYLEYLKPKSKEGWRLVV